MDDVNHRSTAPAWIRTVSPDEMRAAGLDDRAILEVVEVTAHFYLANRIADSLGVALEAPEGP
jgi:alkylhydroperoxidase family enzyme